MMRGKRRPVILWLAGLAALMLTLAGGCPTEGQVVDRKANCTDTGRAEICNYRLKTTGDWFDVPKTTYDKCHVGEQYPKCNEG